MADDKDIFAPPTPEEKAAAEDSMFAPPTKEEKNASSSKGTASTGEALREGFAQGGTFGFAPRLGAAMGAGLEKGAGMLGMGPQAGNVAAGQPQQSLKDLYNEYLDYNNKLQEKAKASHPGPYYGSMIAGGIASPLNKIGAIGMGGNTAEAALAAEKAAAAGNAIQTASMPTKMLLSGLSGARAGALGGLSQSQDLSNINQDVENAGKGAAFGGLLGAGTPPVASALKGAASTASGWAQGLIGPVPKNVEEGFRAGLASAPNLSKPAGQAEAQNMRADFAKDFVSKLRTILSSNAKNKIKMIENHAADLPKDQIDNVLNEILDINPDKLGTEEAAELQKIHNELLRAKEGPMKTETVRQYNPGAQPPPIAQPGSQFLPPLNGPGEMLPPEGAPPQAPIPGKDVTPPPAPPAQQLGPGAPPIQNAPMPQQPPIMGQAEPMASPAPPSPSDFEGYESVHKATIDAGDEEARKAFEQKVHEKLIDEKKLGKNYNDNPVHIEPEPIPGTDKVRLIAMRASQNEDANAFKDQAQQLVQKQREDQRLQALLDKQQEEAMKMRQQQEAEMAKPQFQDIQQQVRAGGRNIQNPQELYNLQQMMQQFGNPVSGRLQTSDMRQVAANASKQLSNVLKQNVGTSDVDATLHAFNNIGEVLGIDTNQLNMPGGTGEKAKNDALKSVFNLVNPENFSDNDLINKEKLGYIAKQLKVFSPEMSESFLQNVEEQAKNRGLVKEFTKPITGQSFMHPILSAARAGISKTAYNAAYNVGDQISKMKADYGPSIQAGQKVFSEYAPQSLQDMASRAATSGDQTMQQFGQVLSKLATADERTRNSMIFVLQQQAGYKAMMDKLMGPQEQPSTQAKDKSLQKFK
jgi:hypothetical protein